MKSYHIITYGCQMNEHDSERIDGILRNAGHASVADARHADMIILNTCSIREKAEQKFFSELGRLKQVKEENPKLVIAVAGCIAQQEGKRILSRSPYVDIIFGTSDIPKLPAMLEVSEAGRKPQIDISGDPDYHRKRLPSVRRDGIKAWVSIMYGCDNYCSYCIVPYLRGRERSRPVEDILQEVSDLTQAGYKEVTLLGQNVNSYGKGLGLPVSFPSLLRQISDIQGLERIRFVTSHPRDLSDALIFAMRDLPKVCESLHLPVQSGSDRILAAMNRKYTRTEYREKIRKLRSAMPDIAITTDIIVGFPGESDQDFERTMNLLVESEFDGIFAFKYSPRPGTAAVRLEDHVPVAIMEKRLDAVFDLQKRITLQSNERLLHSTQEILVDGFSKKGTTICGRTRGNKVVNVKAPADLIGSLINVTITGANRNSLAGSLCESR